PPSPRPVNGHDVLRAAPPRQVAAPPPRPPQVDYATVRQLHQVVADELADVLRAGGPGVDQRAQGERLANERVRAYVDGERRRGRMITPEDEQALLDAVLAELVGLGRLQLLLTDPLVE